MIDATQFRQVLGNYPTGVAAITAVAEDGVHAAMVVGTFTSVSLDPPLVGFFPDKRSSSWPVIERAGGFCVNILGADQQALCRQLATDAFDLGHHLLVGDGLGIHDGHNEVGRAHTRNHRLRQRGAHGRRPG